MAQSADLKWTSTLTNRLLLEVSQSVALATYRFDYQPENGPFAIQNRNSSTGWRTVASSTAYADYLSKVLHSNATLAYVTGTHNLKFGVNHEWGDSRNRLDNRAAMQILTFVNNAAGVPQPNAVTVRNGPTTRLDELNADSGVFLQDRWTRNRLTLFGGARFDYFNASYPDQYAPANPFVPERNVPGQSCQPCWSDWTVRMGGSFDLFGNGKTALKTSIGKFLAANALGLTIQLNPMGAQGESRAPGAIWTETARPSTRTVSRSSRKSVRRRTSTSACPPARSASIRICRGATTGKRPSRSSTSCCRTSRSPAATTGGSSTTRPTPRTWMSIRTATSRRSPSSGRPIRTCPTAAARSSPFTT